MNRHPLTTITVVEIEDVIDLAKQLFANDGRIDETEFGALMTELTEAYHAADHADASYRLGMSWMHNGEEARRSRDLQRSYEGRFRAGRPIDLTQYRRDAKRRRRDCSPNGAA